MANRIFPVGAGLSAALLLGACSLTIDTAKKQCSEDADCGSLNEDFPLQCTSGLCVVQDGAECLRSEACVDSENGPVCNADTLQCTNVAVCKSDGDCKKFDSFESYICESEACEPAECVKTADCQARGAGFTCNMGRCSDPLWGCVGEEDDRVLPMSGTATLKLTVIDLLSSGPVVGLVAEVCGVIGDPDCTLGVAGAKATYDDETSELTVTGLQQGARVRLTLEAPGRAAVDWYTQRTAIGDNVELQPAIMVPAGIGATIGNQFKPPIIVDLDTKATVIARIYNCQEGAASGVSIAVTKPYEDTKIFYLDEANQVLLDEQETTSAGSSGAANVRAEPIRITATREGSKVTEFDFTPRVQRLTYLALYPRKY